MFNQKLATIIAMSIAIFLAIVKFIVGIFSGSVALLASAIDSLMDSAVSIMNYFAVKFSLQPADKEHQFWHGKIEWIASSIEWTVIFTSWLFLIYESIRKIINPEPINYLDFSVFVMIVSIVLTWFLVFYLNKAYKKTNSLIIKADSIHYKTDLITNTGILITLVFVCYTNYIIIDAIVGFILAIYIMKEAYELIKEWVDILLDSSLEEYDDILKILEKFKKSKKFSLFKNKTYVKQF